MASTIEAQGAIDERRLAEAFDRLDSDDSGYITVENLRGILGDDFPAAEVEGILKECAKDGKVSYMDFLGQWQIQKEMIRQDFMADICNLTVDTGSGHPVSQDLLSEEAESTDSNVIPGVSRIQNKFQETSSTSKMSEVTTEPAVVNIKHQGDRDHVYADV